MREQQPPSAAGAYQHFHTAVPARGKFARRQPAAERTTGNREGEERGEGEQRSERGARPGRGSRREPGQAERHRERGVSAVCTGTHSWAMAPWEMTALSEK